MARKPISNKTRFEIFKRDSFKCQYCGKSAPDVVLNIDHIVPVKSGGASSVLNYITSCFQCNSGKGARELSDDAQIKKEKSQLDVINERRNQLKMIVKWKNSLLDIAEDECNEINKLIQKKHNRILTEYGIEKLKKILKKYSFDEVFSAVDNTENYDESKGELLNYISYICHTNKIKKSKPYMDDIYYIRAILRNRLVNYTSYQYIILGYLENLYNSGCEIEVIKDCAKKSKYWNSFKSFFEEK